MRIVQITPGSGDSFYCENCLRDVVLVREMRKLGHEVLLVPMYLPLNPDGGEPEESTPIFFGGLNVYLQQRWSVFRRTPRWLDRLFDAPRLLNWLGRKAGSTSAAELGEMTVSMLKGEHGRQRKELDRLTNWLGEDKSHDDAVVLSNVLLSGLAPALRESLGVPVVCLLQDEEGFLDGLAQPYRQRAWDLIRENLRYISAFISVSRFYAGEMQQRLSIDGERIHVVYAGIEPSAYELSPGPGYSGVPTVGFLSQMCAARGLAELVDAFIELKQDPELANAKLRIAGGMSAADREFVASVLRKAERAGLRGDVEVIEKFDAATKVSFLKSLTVLSVPEKEKVACGLYALEAWAAAVPVVEPKAGVFGELFDRAGGGGILYDPLDKTALHESLGKILRDRKFAAEQGTIGRNAVEKIFNVENSARQMIRLFGEITGAGND